MKRIILIVLILMSIFSVTTVSYGYADDYNNGADRAMEYALSYMKNSQNDESITIREFLEMYDLEDNVTGYYVSFSSKEENAGYLILSVVSNECPVVELSFKGEGILDYACDRHDIPVKSITKNRKIIFLGSYGIFIPYSEELFYSVYDQKIEELESIENLTGEVDLYDGIIDWSDANIVSSSVEKLPSFGLGTDYWLMTDFSSGAVCAPTAATNILWYWGFKRGSSYVTGNSSVLTQTNYTGKASAIFNSVSSGMNTSTASGTIISNIPNGFSHFFGTNASSGGVWNYRQLSNGTSFSYFKAAIDNNCPILLTVRTVPSTGGLGHSVFMLGYASNTTNEEYAFVMDGWYDYGRFINYTYFPYFMGYKIWVRC